MPIARRTTQALPVGLIFVLAGCGSAPPDAGNSAASAAAVAAGDSGSASGPSPLPPEARSSAADERELIRLEHAYAKALIAKDRDFLMRFYASDWRGGNMMGFWSKSTMLKAVLNERYVVRSMDVRDLKVRVLGDVAIVQGVDEETTSINGKDTSGKWSFTDIFAHRGGRWVAVASHTSEVKPAGE